MSYPSSFMKVVSYNVNCLCGSRAWDPKLSDADARRLQYFYAREIVGVLQRAERSLVALQELPAGWMGPGQDQVRDFFLGELERMGYYVIHAESAQVCLCVPIDWMGDPPDSEEIWLPYRVRKFVGKYCKPALFGLLRVSGQTLPVFLVHFPQGKAHHKLV